MGLRASDLEHRASALGAGLGFRVGELRVRGVWVDRA